jgi:rubredoxin
MYYNTCESCGFKKATSVVNSAANKRLGWYCPECKAFSQAVLRETTWREDGGK